MKKISLTLVNENLAHARNGEVVLYKRGDSKPNGTYAVLATVSEEAQIRKAIISSYKRDNTAATHKLHCSH